MVAVTARHHRRRWSGSPPFAARAAWVRPLGISTPWGSCPPATGS